jgi:hypothetical protein
MSGPPHPGDELRHVVDRRFRQDAVPEIEDVRAALHGGQDVIDALLQGLAPGDQRQGIEIALGGQGVGESGRSPWPAAGRL